MPRHLLLGGGRFDQLTNYLTKLLLKKKEVKVTENTVDNPLAAWLPFLDQLSCKFENIGGRNAPTPNQHIPELRIH